MNKSGVAAPSPLRALLKDHFLWILAGLLVLFASTEPAQIASYPSLVDWPTIAAVTGLLVLAKGIEFSGYLHRFGKRLIEVMRTGRSLAILLVLAAALLSMLLTNDAALFIMIPLTAGLHVVGVVPLTRLIIVKALAVNAGFSPHTHRKPAKPVPMGGIRRIVLSVHQSDAAPRLHPDYQPFTVNRVYVQRPPYRRQGRG